MSKQVVVKLQVYRGRGLNYNSNGEITTENWEVSLVHGNPEYFLFLKHMRANGFCHVVVNSAIEVESEEIGSYEETPVSDLSKYKKEVDSYFSLPEKPLTEEQKRIKELEDKLNQLIGKSEAKATKAEPSAPSAPAEAASDMSSEEESVRAEYEVVFGKKAPANKTLARLKSELEAAKS